MGWKAIKDHYRIGHIVQVTDEGICIGSPYIHNIIVIDKNGNLIKRYDNGRSNQDLQRYQTEFDTDPATLRRLIAQEDEFSTSVAVFTYNGADIIETACEHLGWPNVTHGGHIMHENRYSADREQVIAWAKQNAQAGIELYLRSVTEAVSELEKRQALLNMERINLARLEAENPSSRHDLIPPDRAVAAEQDAHDVRLCPVCQAKRLGMRWDDLTAGPGCPNLN